MKFLALFGLIFASTAWSYDQCSKTISKSEMKQMIEEVKIIFYPELKNIELKMEVLKSDAYFLQTCIKPTSYFKSPLKRTYGIQVNEKIFECSPSKDAVRAILVHEIGHVQDYVGMGLIQLGAFAIKYEINRKFHTRYERETDEKALRAGLAEGLKDYRIWIYQWLNERQLKTKKRFYYTPEEIDQWVESQSL